ncbi:thioredoxin family protein [Streptomyces himalayensis]|uniref:Thioredoxin family protein n=1 Tax=Streptomyces himalayensis subsp. himalayensis TaxID=2756131 RepID=A0A7W0IDW9_9ACTN|nr:thioredoxin family protein [Streptomyces himalayensis]MBA2951752.1 thioredoxin family protein [Streptomyces himalayensis subsp. himalayensis]
MELVVLAVSGCPNAPAMLQRLEQVLPESAGSVDVRVISSEEEAARYGMHGSPTLLVNGANPFAAPEATVSVSCRIYRDADGRAAGAPSVEQLAAALQQARRTEG